VTHVDQIKDQLIFFTNTRNKEQQIQ